MGKKKKQRVPSIPAPAPRATADPRRLLSSPLFIAAAMMALAFILYGRTIGYSFACDDRAAIVDNRFTVKGVSGIPGLLSHDLFYGIFGEQVDCLQGGRYRPLSLITFALETQIFGVTAGVYHFTNILLYGLTGFLLYSILRRLLRRLKGSGSLLIPLAASLLFMAHPLHTEVIANIKSRDEELALLLSLIAFVFSLRYFERGRGLDLVAAGAALFLGLMSKETAVVFFILIPLSAWVLLSPDRRRIIRVSASLAVGIVLYLAIRQMVLGTIHAHTTDLINDPFLEASFAQKYATIFYTLLLYLKLLIAPHPLTFDYYPYHIPLLTWADWRPLAGLLANGALLAAAVAGILRKKVWGLCLWAYLLPLGIVSNLLVPIGVFMAERFMYFPSIAFCLFAAYAMVTVIPAGLRRFPGAGTIAAGTVFFIMFLTFSALTFDRTQAWKDDFTLATTDVVVSSESVKSNSMAGDEYRHRADTMTDQAMKREYLARAEKHLRAALAVFPRYETGCVILGRVLQSEGVLAPPQSAGQSALYQASADAFRGILHFNPRSSQAEANLGALFAQQLWNPDSAIIHLRIALGENEKTPDAHYNLGTVFLMTGGGTDSSLTDSAIAHLTRAVQLDAGNADAMNNLGAAYQFRKEYGPALATYQRAHRLRPQQQNIIENISKLYAAMGDSRQTANDQRTIGR
jgi:tetratricopeptide (TPR) repeat protein